MSGFRRDHSLETKLRKRIERQLLVDQAKEVKRHAQAMARSAGAPWMKRSGAPTLVIDSAVGRVRLVNTDHAGHLMEWGSTNNPPHAPLRRGVRAAGLRLEDS